MDITQIKQTLQPLFRDLFRDPSIEISEHLSSKDVENWDSLTNILLFVELEKAFGVRFNSKEIADLADVGQLIESIESKL